MELTERFSFDIPSYKMVGINAETVAMQQIPLILYHSK